jgi:hypothetical protein
VSGLPQSFALSQSACDFAKVGRQLLDGGVVLWLRELIAHRRSDNAVLDRFLKER